MPKEQKTRAQMDARFLWKLEDIYPTDQAWEEDFQKAKPAAARVAAFAGKLEQQLPEALCALEEAELPAESLAFAPFEIKTVKLR